MCDVHGQVSSYDSNFHKPAYVENPFDTSSWMQNRCQTGPRARCISHLPKEQVLSPPDVCVLYILVTLLLRYGFRAVAGGRRPKPYNDDVRKEPAYHSALLSELVEVLGPDLLPDATLSRLHLTREASLKQLWMAARLLKVPDYAMTCLDAFYAGMRPLRLLFRIPEPTELLRFQAEGSRCVSALLSAKLLARTFGHRDCLDMLLHDLAHMEKFVEAGRYWQQVGFFVFLRGIEGRWRLGKRWELSWNYVSSDMNAVANHMLMTLRSQLMVAIARRMVGMQEDEELLEMRADVYPRASMADWKPLLCQQGLLRRFEEVFQSEWRQALEGHVDVVRATFPETFGAPCASSGFGAWRRPTEEEFMRATSSSDPGEAENALILAHFDELGRRALRGKC